MSDKEAMKRKPRERIDYIFRRGDRVTPTAAFKIQHPKASCVTGVVVGYNKAKNKIRVWRGNQSQALDYPPHFWEKLKDINS